ncbi:MAG: pentapeptide repeat-containing protein [Chitinophagales bacterium]|nr:pentapeptide repeat-containing protein [Chitinophagales bacterium]
MKAIIKIFSGIFLGAMFGWFLGFLRLPFVEKNYSFLLGFLACLTLLLLVFLLLSARNKNTLLHRLFAKTSADVAGKTENRRFGIAWIFVSALIVAGCLVIFIMVYRQNISLKAQLQLKDRKLHEQLVLLEAEKQSNMISLLGNILGDAEQELKKNGSISDTVIARIAALSYSLKPYSYFQGDSISANLRSPERGQLLLALLLLHMDSASFRKIKQKTSFAMADLQRANLKNADLSGIDLRGADLKDAALEQANLNDADLRDAILWGANLNKASLLEANLKRSDMRWTTLNGADMQSANLNGAQLSDAQLSKADARKASVQFARLEGTIMLEADLTGANFLGSAMSKINLDQADLTKTDLRMTDLTEASLHGSALHMALVDSNWTDKLQQWRLTGSKEIQANYEVITDSLDQWNHKVYRLHKMK